jgi:hypothetical protein
LTCVAGGAADGGELQSALQLHRPAFMLGFASSPCGGTVRSIAVSQR